jgi:hypothetical protein
VSFDLHVDMDSAGLRRALEEAPGELADGLLDAAETSAAKLQRDWRAGARKSARRHGKHYPSSITHDVTVESGSVSADIGPERARPQGGMGPGFEYGSVHTAPHPDGAAAFARNAQAFDRAVQDAIDQVVGNIE